MLLHFALCALPIASALLLPPRRYREKEIAHKADVEPRIHYGDDAYIRDYPFFAGLFNCGAVIIAPKWVLTAAHCVVDNNHDTVLVGGNTRRNSQPYAIKSIIVHANYNNSLFLNDIALIKLKTPITFSNKVQPVVLPLPQALKAVENEGYELIVRGRDETGDYAKHLQKSKMEVFQPEFCYASFKPIRHRYLVEAGLMEEINEKLICGVREKNRPGFCRGDSGSPLVQGNVLIGIGSYSYGLCEHPNSYLVKVEYYLPWIRNVTKLKF